MAGNNDPLAALAELRRREEELMRMNEELDLKNEKVLRGVITQPKITDSALDGIEDDDVDFKDFDDEDEQEGLKFDYSQVNPYDKKTLKNSQIPAKTVQQHNPYSAHLRHLEDNDDLADSLQLDPRDKPKHGDTLADRGQRLTQKLDAIDAKNATNSAADLITMRQTISEQSSEIADLKRQLDTLQCHMNQAVSDANNKDDMIRKLDDRVNRSMEDVNRLNKEMKAMIEKNEVLKTQNMDMKRQLGSIEKQKLGAERETTMMTKTNKKFETEMSKKEQRINKLTEDLEKAKLELKSHKYVKGEEKADNGKINERLIQENKKLEKQRNELLQGFKKQLKLIEILKRQKVHLEAATM